MCRPAQVGSDSLARASSSRTASRNRFLSIPKMCATGDFAEQGFGMSTLFQTDQGREALTFERQLTEGITVGGDISGKEDRFRQQRLGLGQRLTDAKAQAFGFRAADGNQRSLILAGEQHELRPSKLGPCDSQSLDRPLREPDAQDPRHGRSPTPGRCLRGRPGDTAPRYSPAWFPPGLQPAA